MNISELSEVDRKVIDGIDNAIRARGADWVYPQYDDEDDWHHGDGNCVNLLWNGEPACIIGFIAVDQGLPTRRESAAGLDAARWGVSGAVKRAMIDTQMHQDDGCAWGEVRQEFYRTLRNGGIDTEGREDEL